MEINLKIEMNWIEFICGCLVCNGYPFCGIILILDSIFKIDEDF